MTDRRRAHRRPDRLDRVVRRSRAAMALESFARAFWPLGSALARTPDEARALAALRLGAKAEEADLRAARLVSLSCRVSMGNVAEKVSGFVAPAGSLRPPPA